MAPENNHSTQSAVLTSYAAPPQNKICDRHTIHDEDSGDHRAERGDPGSPSCTAGGEISDGSIEQIHEGFIESRKWAGGLEDYLRKPAALNHFGASGGFPEGQVKPKGGIGLREFG